MTYIARGLALVYYITCIGSQHIVMISFNGMAQIFTKKFSSEICQHFEFKFQFLQNKKYCISSKGFIVASVVMVVLQIW